jgi:F0F1-type ATP synthase assembly protein I
VTARRSSDTPETPSWTSLLGMGVTVAAVFAVCVVIGWLVDVFLGTSPIFVFVGLALGIFGACWYSVNEFRKYLKN